MDNDFGFCDRLNEFFGSEDGAGSVVTEKDEALKAQITITQAFEQPVLFSVFPNVPVGPRRDLGDACLHALKLYPSGETIYLPIHKRPPPRNEVRLYMKANVFRPRAGDFWFVFRKAGELWIGALTEKELDRIESNLPFDTQNSSDAEAESDYQAQLNSDVPQLIDVGYSTFRRDPTVAKRVLAGSGYQCMLLPEHEVFTSRTTQKPYLEAHHLFPMFEQRHFPEQNLDVEENICILNPYAHKMLHHATYSEIEDHVVSLCELKQGFLNAIDVSIDRVLKSYGG